MSRAFASFNALLASVAAFSLQACGGGSGGGGEAAPPPSGSGSSTTVSGHLWHNSLATDGEKRSKLSTLGDAATRYVDFNATAVPNVGGTRYAVFDYNSSGRTTVATIKDAANLASLADCRQPI
jgi:hypothetical protein